MPPTGGQWYSSLLKQIEKDPNQKFKSSLKKKNWFSRKLPDQQLILIG